jgi:Thrombospondin type 3 repeat
MRQAWVCLIGVGAALMAASPAAASTTFGADLSVGGAGSDCTPGGCLETYPFTAGDGPSDNYGTISVVVGADDGSSATAPSSGVLVSYSVRLGTAHMGRVRLMHDPGGTPQSSGTESVTLSGTGNTVSVPGDGASHSYLTRLPITQGDLIGFEVQGTGSQAAALFRADYGGSASANRRLRWYGGVPDGVSNPSEAQISSSSVYRLQAPVQGVIEPDADGDGFGDQSQDQCLAQAGSSNGCPDSDGDGIPDASDACPTQSDASAPRNPRTGCPAEAPATDTDSDGIPDSSDACPTQSDLFAQRNPRNGCAATPLDKKPPVISSFALSPTSFVAANSGPAVVAAATVGTHVFYKLSEPATTTFTVERKGTGVKKKGKCVRGRAKHGQKACTLYSRVKGKIVRGSAAGLTSFRFMGRLNGSSLKPGSYRLVASARDGAGNTSKSAPRSFKIKHP